MCVQHILSVADTKGVVAPHEPNWSIAGKENARGREKTLGATIARRIKRCIETYRFVAVVRAPWVKKHLKLKCSTRTVHL